MQQEKIFDRLISRKASLRKELLAVGSPIVQDLFSELVALDIAAIKESLKAEIETNLKEWWTNGDKIDLGNDQLKAILFEYGDDITRPISAPSYGLIEVPGGFPIAISELGLNWNCDYQENFYAAPGISMPFFQPFHKPVIEEVMLNDSEDLSDIIELFALSGYLIIREAIEELDAANAFDEVPYENNMLFLICQHDTSAPTPLYLIGK